MSFKLTLTASQEAHGPQNSPNLLTCHLKVLRRTISKINFLKFENFFQASLHGDYSRNGGNFLFCGLTQTKKSKILRLKHYFGNLNGQSLRLHLFLTPPKYFFDLMAQSACPTNMKIHIFYAFLMIFAKKAVCTQEGSSILV